MLKGLSIPKKLAAGFSLVVAFMIVVAIYSTYQLRKLNDVSAAIRAKWLPAAVLSAEMNAQAGGFRRSEYQQLMAGSSSEMAEWGKTLEDRNEKFTKGLSQYRALITTVEEKQAFEALVKSWGDYLLDHKSMMQSYRAGSNKQALELMRGHSRALFDDVSNQLQRLTTFNVENADKAAKMGDSAYRTARKLLFSLILASLAICAGVATWIIQSITGPIREVVARLKAGSDQMATASSQISTSGSELSASATQQAAALQQTMSSVDEVSAMVSKNAENAKRSQQVSDSSKSSVERGKGAVDEMIHSIEEINRSNSDIMSQIEDSNREISEIVNVISEIGNKTKIINDIVFQTKLLSFNASVEAARAGEHGKGFAVVAEEVGNLAQMSGNAAKEISQMLDSSTRKVQQIVTDTKTRVEQLVATGKEKVENGTHTARRCGEILDEVVANVNTVNQMVSEIATASQEQSRGVQEITRAMSQLDQVTQTNAASARQSAGAAESLTAQSEELRRSVRVLVATVEGGTFVAAPAFSMMRKPAAPKGRAKPASKPAQRAPGAQSQEPILAKPAFAKPAAPAKPDSNVVPLKRSKPKAPRPEQPLKSVVNKGFGAKIAVGSDVVPSENDPRFEDV